MVRDAGSFGGMKKPLKGGGGGGGGGKKSHKEAVVDWEVEGEEAPPPGRQWRRWRGVKKPPKGGGRGGGGRG